MDIANADGATVRADITAALKALASNSAGNSAPSTPYTGQTWIDTNTPSATEWTVFQYDGADWIDVGHLDITANSFEPTIGSALALHADGFVFAVDTDTGIYRSAANTMKLKTGGADLGTLTTTALTIGTTDETPYDASGNNPGIALQKTGFMGVAVNAFTVAAFNRQTDDGAILDFRQDGTNEGSISVAGNTVSYNAFAGAHWSQFADGSRPDLPRGTVLSTVDQLCQWKAVEFTTRQRIARLRPVPRMVEETVEQDVEVIDRAAVEQDLPVARDVVTVGADGVRTVQRITFVERQIVQMPTTKTEKRQVTKRRKVYDFEPDYHPGITKHVLYDGPARPGEVIDFDYGGELVRATVVLERNARLPCCKVSDVAGDRAVYGVFNGYDGDGDVSVMALGAFNVRVAKGETLQAGDLLESDGAGCARVQAGDHVLSSTVAKVTSTVPVETYDDGSFLVPCTLMCG
jgi:hypothetical protein